MINCMWKYQLQIQECTMWKTVQRPCILNVVVCKVNTKGKTFKNVLSHFQSCFTGLQAEK